MRRQLAHTYTHTRGENKVAKRMSSWGGERERDNIALFRLLVYLAIFSSAKCETTCASYHAVFIYLYEFRFVLMLSALQKEQRDWIFVFSLLFFFGCWCVRDTISTVKPHTIFKVLEIFAIPPILFSTLNNFSANFFFVRIWYGILFQL